uniref:Uncharacterized protein n=1 Tax=Opuntia streptacantha TaxID=393608 RepID=A0A7C9D3U3_OPUST
MERMAIDGQYIITKYELESELHLQDMQDICCLMHQPTQGNPRAQPKIQTSKPSMGNLYIQTKPPFFIHSRRSKGRELPSKTNDKNEQLGEDSSIQRLKQQKHFHSCEEQ